MNQESYTTKELGLLMQSLTSKIDQFMEDNHEQHCEMNDTLKEHNGRLKKSEKWQERITGGFVVASVLVLPFVGWYIYYTQALLGKAVEAQTKVGILEANFEKLNGRISESATFRTK